jgi:hypothetical protein
MIFSNPVMKRIKKGKKMPKLPGERESHNYLQIGGICTSM